jgi:phosphoribosylglycinamide formyltransferase-1
MRVVVLASGRGSNLDALLKAERHGELPARIVGVVSDKTNAAALDIARAAGIAAIALDPREHADRAAFDHALFARIAGIDPDLIVLAGFMRILDPVAFEPWLGRIINIHPSLLPRYPGLHTHRRALEAGDTQHGASVHFVTAELDGGPVIAQATIAITPGDTPTSLAARLLPAEHRLLSASVALIASGRIALTPAGAVFYDHLLTAPLQLADQNLVIPPA